MVEMEEIKVRVVIGAREKDILKTLIDNGGCVEGILELLNKAYGFRYHTKEYLRGLTRRIYRMEEKGLIFISKSENKNRGRKRKKICITSVGLKKYYEVGGGK